MKRLFLTLILTLPFLSPTFGRGTELKVMSYNIYHAGMASLEQLGDFINEHRPDVVFLQEVDVNTKRQNRHTMAELGNQTKMFTAFGKSIPLSGGYYGLGILSRYPIVGMERILLPMLEAGREQRSLLKAIIELENGRQVCVACTHLDLKTEERVAQVEHLNKVLKATGLPVLVGGDFNAQPQDKEIKQGMADWMRAMAEDAYTFPQDKPDQKIDYIFAHPRQAWQIRAASVPPVELSDHRPVVVEYELLTE